MKRFAFQLLGVGLVFAGSLVGIRMATVSGDSIGIEGEDYASNGRKVYIAEGCINCHSQYLREGTLDTEIWGPASLPPSGNDAFVLIGNRRQGPDLSNIGARRSREWNRAHLINPGLLSVGSRMPSYAHLFERGHIDEGGALLDYLDTLVAKDSQDWWNFVLAWNPVTGFEEGQVDRGKKRFANNCVQCHGVDGRGEGRVAGMLVIPPRNLVSESFRFVPDSLDEADRRAGLARIIKFGIAGTSMPGHESLTDSEVVDLLAYLQSLREAQSRT